MEINLLGQEALNAFRSRIHVVRTNKLKRRLKAYIRIEGSNLIIKTVLGTTCGNLKLPYSLV